MNRYVLSVSRCLIPAFVTACLVTGALAQQGQQGQPSGPANVNVVNTPSVTVVNPADIANALGIGQPVHFQALCQNSPNTGNSGCEVQIGPGPNDPNTRLVIEYVSAVCNLQPQNTTNLLQLEVNTTVAGQDAIHFLNVSDHVGGVDNAGLDNVLSVGQVVRFSHDWSKPLTVEAAFTQGANLNGRCLFELDGQRVRP